MERAISVLYGDKEMVVTIRGDDVTTDASLRQGL
jgi:hypothetical protein